MRPGEIGVINGSKSHTSTAIGGVLGVISVSYVPKAVVKDGGSNKVQSDKPAPQLHPEAELSTDRVSVALHHVSANSSGEIDNLISDLRGLREKLETDCLRIEQGIGRSARLSQSVMRLMEIASNSIARVQAIKPAAVGLTGAQSKDDRKGETQYRPAPEDRENGGESLDDSVHGN
jgi:hypothetical protein